MYRRMFRKEHRQNHWIISQVLPSLFIPISERRKINRLMAHFSQSDTLGSWLWLRSLHSVIFCVYVDLIVIISMVTSVNHQIKLINLTLFSCFTLSCGILILMEFSDEHRPWHEDDESFCGKLAFNLRAFDVAPSRTLFLPKPLLMIDKWTFFFANPCLKVLHQSIICATIKYVYCYQRVYQKTPSALWMKEEMQMKNIGKLFKV